MTGTMTINGKTLEQFYDEEFDDFAQDAKVDRWHNGYFMAVRGLHRPTDADEAAGWDHRANEGPVVEVSRPEGYYHAPIGTFE
jgi:hypothetical protein